jgi:pimeloyl-[acyl-carrier protein] methyl ester esterase
MKNLIITGFATTPAIFQSIISLIPHTEALEIPDFNYSTVEKQMELHREHGKVNLLGWSLGSLYAIKWTLEHPGLVNTLTLLGATPSFTAKEGYDNGIPEAMLDKMIRLIRLKPKAVLKDFYQSIFRYTSQPEILMESQLANDFSDMALSEGLSALKQFDLRRDIGQIQCPVEIIHGSNDPITPLYGALWIAERITGSRLTVTEGGHCVFLENKDLFIDLWKKTISITAA